MIIIAPMKKKQQLPEYISALSFCLQETASIPCIYSCIDFVFLLSLSHHHSKHLSLTTSTSQDRNLFQRLHITSNHPPHRIPIHPQMLQSSKRRHSRPVPILVHPSAQQTPTLCFPRQVLRRSSHKRDILFQSIEVREQFSSIGEHGCTEGVEVLSAGL